MPASRSGCRRHRAWRVAQRAGGLCNKSAVELSENFNLTSYWYSYTSLNQVFVNFCGVTVDVFSSYCFWKSRVRFQPQQILGYLFPFTPSTQTTQITCCYLSTYNACLNVISVVKQVK